MPNKKHEPEIDTYSIGHADSLQADYVGGTFTIEFDLQQVRENDYIRYFIREFRHGTFFDTPEIPDNKTPAQCLADNIDRRTEQDIRAYLVPEHLTKAFKDVEGYEILYTPR